VVKGPLPTDKGPFALGGGRGVLLRARWVDVAAPFASDKAAPARVQQTLRGGGEALARPNGALEEEPRCSRLLRRRGRHFVPRELLDTDILSEILKNRDATVARAAADYLAKHGEFTVSVVSVMEIAYGLHRAGRTRQLEEFETTLGNACHMLPPRALRSSIRGRGHSCSLVS
jgi:hypothetical protein